MSADKEKLRAQARALRNGISAKERADASAVICDHILTSPLFQNCRTLLCYAPLGSEVDVLAIAKAALAMKKAVGFPICNGENMEFYTVHSLDGLSAVDAFGIRIPDADERSRIRPDAHTLVLLPALAFDKSGNRIGYGKGYYDRYLHRFPAPTALGVAYAATLFASIPEESTDIPAAYLATENGIIRTY